MHLNGENLKCHLKGESCKKLAVELNINDSEKHWIPGAHLPPTRGNIHANYHNIKTSSPLNKI